MKQRVEFEKDLKALSSFNRALGHPARISILQTLAERNECICGEIVDVLPLAQSTVSQHLSDLKKAGLIKGRIYGTRSCYCIDWENFSAMVEEFRSWSDQLLQHKDPDACC